MTPIERAARALWEANGQPMKAQSAAPSMQIPESEPDWQRFVPQVRAVIAAIREPSEGMDDAGTEAGELFMTSGCHATRCWQAMIDQMLEEGK
jgi:hypothetical protein